MASPRPTLTQCDELLAFLPIFEDPEQDLKATWPSTKPDPVTGVFEWPHPTNHPLVDQFFFLAGQPWWRVTGPDDCSAAAEMIQDDAAIARATLQEIRMLLSCCVQMERFVDGLQDSLVRDGRMVLVLKRLGELRGGMGE